MEIRDDDQVQEAAERCARLESWMQIERGQVERERLAEALRDARRELTQELDRAKRRQSLRDAGDVLAKGIENASQQIGGLLVPGGGAAGGSQIFPDGNVTDFLKHLDEAAAEKKEARQLAAELEPSREITERPEYKELYEKALGRFTAEAEAVLERRAAADLEHEQYADVPELQPGHEIEGEVEAVVMRDDRAFYIVKDHDNALTAIEAEQDGPEMDVGDDIEARRDNDGSYDIGPGYGYGR